MSLYTFRSCLKFDHQVHLKVHLKVHLNHAQCSDCWEDENGHQVVMKYQAGT